MEKIEKFLVDSDIIIDFLRGFQNSRDFLLGLKNKGTFFISVVSIVEIYSVKDIANSAKKQAVEDFFVAFETIVLDRELAKQAGAMRLKYQIPFADAIIAATAVSFGLTLITRNKKHFTGIDGLLIQSP